ncbi:MAG: glycosyltransferase [Ruminiclostridium sp.]
MDKVAFCTIVSKSYLCYARNLHNSLKKNQDNFVFFTLISDEIESKFNKNAEEFMVIEAKELLEERIHELSFKYDILEFNTCLKPILIKYLMQTGYKKVIYLDADIYLFNSFDKVIELLDEYSLILTPHLTERLPSSYNDKFTELQLLKDGVFNTGLLAFSDKSETHRFLDWFIDKCLNECYNEPENGLFVDQKWLELSPCLLDHLLILRDKCYNMAYWNLHERRLTELLVNDTSPLVFFHFSGMDINDINSISKHQKWYSLSKREDLRPIFEIYRNGLLDCGYEETIQWNYSYSRYDNSEIVGSLARRLYSNVKDEFKYPFSTHEDSFYQLLKKKGMREKSIDEKIKSEEVGTKIKIMNSALKILSRIFGANRYKVLMRYLRYVSVIRRQDFLIK